jgi:PAS domain S-box-containing protein
MKTKKEQFSATSSNPVLRVDKDGTVLYSNEPGKILLNEWGVEIEGKLPSSIAKFMQKVISRNSPEKMEVRVGKRVYLTVFHPSCEEKCVFISGFDMSGQKVFKDYVQESKAQEMANVKQQECELEVAFLSLLNENKRTVELVHSAVSFFREQFDLEAVGIRLQREGDYPYFETSGFPKEFVRMENSLCVQDEIGQPIYDSAGNPIRECMCGNVICRLFDPLKPFFTARGSFWTNSTTELLATYKDAGLQVCMCNRCNSRGYESVALIVLQVNEDILGLLQLNDTRKGWFSPDRVEMWERLGGYLAIALAKKRGDELLLEAYETLLIQAEKLEVQSEELQVTNETLCESEEKYRNIVETANEGISLFSSEGFITYANKKMAEMLGYTINEIIDRSVSEFVVPEDESAIRKKMENRNRELNDDIDTKLIRKDGSFLWALMRSKPFFDDSGKFIGSLCMVTDITERKQAEDALKKSEERYRTLAENSPDMVARFDRQYRQVYANPAAIEFSNILRDEVIAKTQGEPGVPTEKMKLWSKHIENSFSTGKIETLEYQHTSRQGKKYYFNLKIVPEFVDGKVVSALAISRDITEFKEAETKLKETLDNLENLVKERTKELELAFNSLKESEKSLAEAQRMAHIGNWEWNIATDKAYWSEEMYRIYGRNPQDLAPSLNEFINYIESDDQEYVINAFKKGPRKEPFSIDYRIILASGEERTVIMQSEVIFDEQNKPLRIKGIVQDITEYNKSEEKIRRLANIVESSNDAIGTISPEGIITSWNKGAEQIYGYSDEEILGKHVSIAAPPHLSDETKKLSERIKQGEIIDHYETLRLRKDGKVIDVSITLSPVYDSHGKLTAISFISRDITERKKIEEKNKMLANIVESSSDAIVTRSLEGIISSWNRGAEQVYGYSAEEVLGKPVSILIPSHSDEEGRELTEMIKKGERIHHYETSRLRKDGKIIDASLNLSPVFGSFGELIAISVIARDITERKKIEEKLRESEEKYRNIVETASEGILIIDNESRVTYANKKLADMLGYTLGESIGRPIWDFLSEESKAVVKLNMKNRCLGIADSYELKLIRKDGSLLWAVVNAKPLFDKDDKFVGSMSMLTDITMRKEAEKTIANFEIAREKEIHHRIKNNLQIVSSLLDLQTYKFKGRNDINDSEVVDAFRESQSRVISMALIHEELYKGGGLETINFSEYVEKLADNLLSTYRLGNTCISLNKDLEGDLFLDMDTAIPLGTIINEIVSNSFKHAFPDRDKGEIRIKLHREEGDFTNFREENKCESPKSTDLILSVSDNGVGIPQNLDIENLDSLGLHLVTSLVEQLDGKLEIKINNGTEFVIKFTVTEKNSKEKAPAPKKCSESPKFLN